MNPPPGPRDCFFGIPQVRRMKQNILKWFIDLQTEFGDIVQIKMGPFRYVLVFDPEGVKEVLISKAKHFERSPRVREVLGQWNGSGIILSEGELWARQRRIVQQGFSGSRFEGYASVIQTHVAKLLHDLPSDEPVDIERVMTDLTLIVITHAMFGEALENPRDTARAVAILSKVSVAELESPFTSPDWIPTRWKKDKRWAMKLLDDLIWSYIRKRQTSGEDKGDLLSKLLIAVDNEGDGRGMSERQARDECMGLLLAGHDTTAAGLIWIFYNLAKHPKAQERARTEALANEVSFGNLKQFRYIEAVVKESLRLYPPAIGVFQRIAVEDTSVCGFSIPKNTLIQPISFVVQRDSRFFPNPLSFEPERFFEDVHPFAYFPFGAGPRACIGRNLAMMEMTIVTAMVLKKFQLSLSDPSFEPVLQPDLSLRPRNKVWLVLNRN